jgi:hypothetical protein
MVDRGYYIDEQTFLDLQACVTRLLDMLEGLLQPPPSEERGDLFEKLFPIVETLHAFLTAIIEGRDLEFGRIQEAVEERAQQLDEQMAVGTLTLEAYRHKLVEIVHQYDRAIATLLAERAQKKVQ